MVEILTDQIFEDVVDTIREPLLILDQGLRVILASRSFYEFFKVKPEKTVGQLIYDLGNKQWDIPKLRELLETILPEKTTFDDYEVEHEFATIGKRTMLLNARQVERELGKERIILLAIEDITRHKRLEDLLIDSEERYRRLFETADDGILLLEKSKLKIRHANPAIMAMLGYSNEELIGKDMNDIGFPDDIGTFQEIMQTLNEDGISHCKEVAVQKKAGQSIYTDIYMTDRADLIQCNIREITERKLAEELLRDSEDRFRTIYEESPIGIEIFNSNGQLLNVNKSCLDIFGVSDIAEVKEFSIFEDPNIPVEERENLRKGGKVRYEVPFDFEKVKESTLYKTTKSGIIYLDVQITPLGLAIGESVNGYLVQVVDITDYKRAEDALRKSQKMLARTERISHIGSWEWEIATDTVTWSEELFRIFQLDPDDGAPSWAEHAKLYHPEDFAPLCQAVEVAVANGTPYEMELRAFRKDGEIRVCHASGFTERGSNGKLVRLFGSLHDITERKQVEENLRESDERYRGIFERSLELVYLCDFEGNFIDANDAALEGLGYTKKDMKSINFASLLDEHQLPRAIEAVEEMLKTGSQKSIIEFQLKRKDGGHISIESKGAIIYREGKPYAIQGVARNITERKKIEEERNKLIHELQNALQQVKTLGGLLPICSHCKKIRDDKGYWNQIESYLHENSDAEFSHSICPECAEKYHPDMHIYDEDETQQ